MKFNELNLTSKKSRKRVGRGIGSGRGKTAGRGTKGQNARTGGGVRPGFEGGQNPLMKRLPKIRGFKSKRPKATLVHTDQLNDFAAGSEITKTELLDKGILSNPKRSVKLLSRGKLTKKLTITVDAFSKKAAADVEAAGGKVTRVSS